MYGGREVAQFTVDFGGRYRRIRTALSSVVGLYNAARIYPDISVLVNSGLVACLEDLFKAG
jgi:hypothetical protein